MDELWLIAGLGNPGPKYERNWHNLGFLTLEILEQRHNFHCRSLNFKSLTARVKLGGKTVLFLKPQTFMNLSGEAVAQAARFYKIPPERCLIILDDVDLAVGTVRLRARGSAGTHNGLRSVLADLGTEEFPRLRVGCGPKPEFLDMVDFVLQNIPKDKQETAFSGLSKAADAVETFLREGIDVAANRFNGR